MGIYESSVGRDDSGPLTAGTNVQINTAMNLATMYPSIVNMVVVGNECIAGEAPSTPTPVSLSTLITDLGTVKAGVPGTTTVTTYLTYQAGIDLGGSANALLPAVGNVMVNVYPFYGGVAIDGALANLTNAYNLFNSYGKPVWIGETGWPRPTALPLEQPYPSLANEKSLLRECSEPTCLCRVVSLRGL